MKTFAVMGIGILANALARVVDPSVDWITRLPLTILYTLAMLVVFLYLIDRIESPRG